MGSTVKRESIRHELCEHSVQHENYTSRISVEKYEGRCFDLSNDMVMRNNMICDLCNERIEIEPEN